MQRECGLDVVPEEFVGNTLKFGLMEVGGGAGRGGWVGWEELLRSEGIAGRGVVVYVFECVGGWGLRGSLRPWVAVDVT